jgi:glycosyltransferase involved in cell wall biosynthesis
VSEHYNVLVPVYEEAENIIPLIEQADEKLPRPFTLHVIHDRPEDSTVPVVQGLQDGRPWLKLLHNDIAPGVVHAIRKGFEEVSEGPAIVMMADLSDDLDDVPRMLELYQEGGRVVCPSRYAKGGRQVGGPWLKGFLSRMAGLSLRLLVRFPTSDATNNFRLYDAALVRDMGIESRLGFEVALELTAKAFRRRETIRELPTTWQDRETGESRFRIMKWLPGYLKWYGLALTGFRWGR